MVRQQFDVGRYWRVIVYYDVDYNLFYVIADDLVETGFSQEEIDNLYGDLRSGKAKAVTCSSLKEHISVVILPEHVDKTDYINSIVHEAEHVKQAMLKVYGVEDQGEPPAYTIGHIVGKMYKVFAEIICHC